MTRSLWTGVAVDLRRSVRPAFLITGIALAAFLLIGGAAVGVVYGVVKRAQPDSQLSSAIPLSQFTSGMLQAFECVRVGGDDCDQYDQAVNYLSQGTPADGLRYTALDDDDPGAEDGDARTVQLNDELSGKDWHAVATAVTLDGQATELTVPPSAVRTARVDATTFAVPGSEVGQSRTGTMTFTVGEDTVQLKSVTYG